MYHLPVFSVIALELFCYAKMELMIALVTVNSSPYVTIFFHAIAL